jgi:predicted DCC family thiol-disulfide oxidoreductase YuxK
MHSQVILFDGVCNLCNSAVQIVIKNDKNSYYKFASLQSEFAQNFLKKNNLSAQDFSTLILIQDDQYFKKSKAIFKIVKHLPNYSWLGFFSFLPLFFTDFVYDLISNNRFKWFGKRASCWLPNSELKDRFL